MTTSAPPTRTQIVVQLVGAGLLLWLYGGDLIDALRMPGAELASFDPPPTAGFPVVALVVALAAIGLAAYGHVKKLGGAWKGFRVLPIAVVTLLFFDLVVLSSTRTPISASERAVVTVHEFARRANSLSTPKKVASEEAELHPLLKDIGAPPYFIRGERVKEFTVEIRQGCQGPSTERGMSKPGTLIYCLAPNAQAAWVTLVGLPLGSRFGTAAVVTRGDLPVAAEVQLASSDAPEPEEMEELGPPPEEPPDPNARFDRGGGPLDPPPPAPTPPAAAADAG